MDVQNKGFEYYKMPLLSIIQQQRCLTIMMKFDKDKLISLISFSILRRKINSDKVLKV